MSHNVIINGRFVSRKLTGIQRYALEITKRLNMNKKIITFQPPLPQCNILDNLIIDPLCSLSKLPHFDLLWEQFFLPRFVERDNLLWSPSGIGPIFVKNQVVTIHDLAFLDHPEWFSPYFVKWYSYIVPTLARRVLGIITVSEFSKSRIIERLKIPAEKIKVIYPGISSAFVPKSPSEIELKLKDINIPTSKYLFTLSTIEPRKNLKRLLDAWRIAQSYLRDDIYLVVGGTKGKTSVFRDVGLETIPEKVIFLDYVPDEVLPYLYSGALFFVYPSLYEGFGLPPPEAMACGCPVITSSVASIPEACGDAALYCDPYNTDDIAQKIVQLAKDDNLRSTLRKKGLERVKMFSWDKAAEEHIKLFKEIMDKGGKER
jgi:glycosyltransferase involved in cell wall biosynthesis